MRCSRAFLALLLLTACTEKEKKPDPGAALREARARLAFLAQTTADAKYDAQYRFVQLPSNTAGVIRIRQAPPAYRIDIIRTNGASFFSLPRGAVSCSSKGTKKTCYRVSGPGQEVPGLFDPGVQRLFRDAVEDLAANPDDYLVTRVDATPTAEPAGTGSATTSATTSPKASPKPVATASGSLPIPPAECFRVERTVVTPNPDEEVGFENGTYCFAEQGVATSIAVDSGTLTLVKLLGPPPAAAFEPPALIRDLPKLTPKPTPSKKK